MAWALIPRIAAVAALALVSLQSTARAADSGVTPVAKVIDLLTGLAKEVQDEGKREAATYEKFSCFCKDSSASKADEITKGADKIDGLSSSIEAKSAETKDKQEKISERAAKQETLSAELDDEKARCLKEEHTYDARHMELTKAIAGIGDALKSLATARKGGASASSLLDLHSSVSESLALADALEMVRAPARADVTGFLQVDPNDADYKSHTNNIDAVLKMLQEDYTKKKDELDGEWTKTDTACTQTKGTLRKDLKNNKDAITKLTEKVEGLGMQIAKAKEDLLSEQTALQDAQGYLRDLTLRCEGRAKDWDQRTTTRNEEFEALSRALGILKGKVKAAASVNKRALLLSSHAPVLAKKSVRVHSRDAKTQPVPAQTALTSTEMTTDDVDSNEIATELTALEGSNAEEEVKPAVDMPAGDSSDDVASWLHGGAASFLQVQSAGQRQQVVQTFVQQEGSRLGSTVLTSLAARMASFSGDPFGKVKGLIQDLIERLLHESAGEATKKGFCDEQLAKTNQARQYSFEEANKLSAEIKELEVNQESLDSEADELEDRIANLNKEFAAAKGLREQEQKDNAEALAKAKEGLEAVTDAYDLLKAFYNKAGSASFVQASPVDEDAPDAPEGDYKGNQGAAQGILGLLQVIVSDFERTEESTSKAEKKGAAEFEEAKQNFEADVAGHTTKRSLDIQDSKTTRATIRRKSKDMKFAMDSVDAHSKTLKDLEPTCVDHGRMSFKERTEKREAEMAALKEALCKLDPDGVESDCK